jgi:hypothetical protein
LVQGARLLLGAWGAWYVELWNLAMVSLQLPPNFQGQNLSFQITTIIGIYLTHV